MIFALTCLLQPIATSSFSANISPTTPNNRGSLAREPYHDHLKINSACAFLHAVKMARPKVREPSRRTELSMSAPPGQDVVRRARLRPASEVRQAAKLELLRLLAKDIYGPPEHERMELVLESLKKTYVPIQTAGFFSLAIKVRGRAVADVSRLSNPSDADQPFFFSVLSIANLFCHRVLVFTARISTSDMLHCF